MMRMRGDDSMEWLAVCVARTHREDARPVVRQLEVLVLELRPIDRLRGWSMS